MNIRFNVRFQTFRQNVLQSVRAQASEVLGFVGPASAMSWASVSALRSAVAEAREELRAIWQSELLAQQDVRRGGASARQEHIPQREALDVACLTQLTTRKDLLVLTSCALLRRRRGAAVLSHSALPV